MQIPTCEDLSNVVASVYFTFIIFYRIYHFVCSVVTALTTVYLIELFFGKNKNNNMISIINRLLTSLKLFKKKTKPFSVYADPQYICPDISQAPKHGMKISREGCYSSRTGCFMVYAVEATVHVPLQDVVHADIPFVEDDVQVFEEEQLTAKFMSNGYDDGKYFLGLGLEVAIETGWAVVDAPTPIEGVVDDVTHCVLRSATKKRKVPT
jgi:hypothetical protein